MSGFDWFSADSYYEFTGLSESELRARQLFYLQFFRSARRIADVGCGSGVFLEAAREEGIDGVGIDADAGRVQRCREKGLEAEVGDGGEFLARHPNAFDGIFCSHVVEHLSPEDVSVLSAACYKALHPGGAAVFVTPNPEAIHVHLKEFWRDPTHIRPYSKEALSFLIASAGFTIEKAEENTHYSTGRDLIGNAMRTGHWYSRIFLRPVLERVRIAMRAAGLDAGNELFVLARRP